ncbi:MAG: hypothetical protein PVJ80_06200 [Gemmatimonadota bacterium]
MTRRRCALVRTALGIVFVACSATPALAQRIPFEKRFFNEQVLRGHAQPVVPIFEGFYENEDGTRNLCFGYFNLNLDEPVDIPLGERNRIEPARYDGRQPTHFVPVPGMTEASQFTSRFRRIWCAFTVTVPADFTRDDKVWWTLHRDGEDGPVRVPGTIKPTYVLDEPASDGMGELAPVLRFSRTGSELQGKRGATSDRLTARVGQPLELRVWLEHPFEEQLWVGWLTYRGPDEVTFAPAEQEVQLEDGRAIARTTATFSRPGEYELLVQSIDRTANFEFHCCWTNGYVPVTVEP